LDVAAWVKLVKVQADGTETVEEVGPATRSLEPEFSAIMEPGTRGLVAFVKMSMFQKKIQFPATESVPDVLIREGFVDPFVKNVSDEVDIGGGKKEIVVTAYSGVIDLVTWFRN
jgi:hypothetical protein